MAKVKVPQWGRLDKFYWVDEVSAASSGSSATTSTAGTTTVTNPVAAPLTPPRQTLDKIPDGTAYAKPLATQLTSGGIDFSKTGFLNKTIDYVGDGSTYLRMPGANMDSNRRGLIDFTQSGHLSKNLDYIGDTGSHIRASPRVDTAGSLQIDNADCALPANPDGSLPGWDSSTLTSGATLYADTSSPDTGYAQSYALETPSGSSAQILSIRKWTCRPGDVGSITARVRANNGPNSAVWLGFFNSAGTLLGVASAATGSGVWTTASASAVAPANTTYAQLIFQCNGNTGVAYAGLQWIRASINDVRVAGSGAQLGDQRNGWPILYAGAQAVWQNLSITYTSAAPAASGDPATATISVSAAQLLGALQSGATIAYNASSASVSGTAGTTQTFQLYYIDPKLSGGTLTLYATTTGNDLRQQLGIVWIGSVSVAFPTTGTGSGSGGGGLCVADDMWLDADMRAGDVSTGYVCDCVDWATGAGKHQRSLLGVTRGVEECVRLETDCGAELVCSISTPFDLPDGRHTFAPHMLGETVLTDWGLERIARIESVGERPVSRLHLGGVSYAAGEHRTHRIYSHNTSTSKP